MRFRFGMRTLLLTLTVASLFLGSLAWRRERARLKKQLNSQLREFRYDIEYYADPEDWFSFQNIRSIHFSDLRSDSEIRRDYSAEEVRRFWEIVAQVPKLKELEVLEGLVQPGALRLSPGLERLEIRGGKLNAADLKRIGNLTKLRKLFLWTEVRENDLQELKNLTQLREFSTSQLSDGGLKYLASSVELEKLNLPKSTLSAEGCRVLAAFPGLKELRLDDAALDEQGLWYLPNTLEVLVLAGTSTGDAGAQLLGNCTKLRVLDLEGTRVSDAGLKHWTWLSRLETLDLNQTFVTGAGLQHLPTYTLRELQFGGWEPGQAAVADCLPHLANFTNLTRLHVCSREITAADLQKQPFFDDVRLCLMTPEGETTSSPGSRPTFSVVEILGGRIVDQDTGCDLRDIRW